MRKLVTSVAAAFILCLFSVAILADDKDKMLKEHVQISSDVMVGNTHVKKGYYLVKYNEETGMMKIVKANNHKKVVATAKATVKMNDKDFDHDEILTRNNGGREVLTGLRLGGQKEELTLTDSVASSQ